MHENNDQSRLSDFAADIFAGRPISRLRKAEKMRLARVLNARDVSVVLATAGDLEEVRIPDTGEADRLSLKHGDLVITSRGVIRNAVAEKDHEGAIVGANLVVVRLHLDYDPVILSTYLRHPRVMDRLLQDFRGSTTAGFSVETLRDLPLRMPAPEESKELSELARLSSLHYLNAIEAAELRKAMTQEFIFRSLQGTD